MKKGVLCWRIISTNKRYLQLLSSEKLSVALGGVIYKAKKKL
jgi:hypothetical protein